MATSPLHEVNKDESFTLNQAVDDVGGPIGKTYKSIGINTLKALGAFLYGIVRTVLYLLLLIPQLIQLIVFLLFLYIISKLWGSLKIIYQILAGLFNTLIPGPLIAWNVIATIFNIIGIAMKIVGMSLPKLPVVKNPFGIRLPPKMPTAVEFVTMILMPVAKATKNSVHGMVYEK